MSVGTKWTRAAEAAGAARVALVLDGAERELGDLLPEARIERGTGELRIGAPRLAKRWLAEPGLRFVLWRPS